MTMSAAGTAGRSRRACWSKADLSDQAKLTALLKDRKIDAVMHFAALALVGESVEKPDLVLSQQCPRLVLAPGGDAPGGSVADRFFQHDCHLWHAGKDADCRDHAAAAD